jgi:endoglucanase
VTISTLRPHRLATLVTVCALAAIVGAVCQPASAAADSGNVSLDQPAYTAHENQGYLTITLQRTGDVNKAEHVGYGVKRQDAQPGIDFDTVPNTYITIPPGQSTYTFQVRIIDQGINATPVQALAYLYSAWPDPLGTNHNSLITILHDDALGTRDTTNPLEIPGPITGNPIAGTRFYVDPASPAAAAARHFAGSKPAWAGLLNRIASAPTVHRFYMWNIGGNVAGQVAHYLEATQLQQPGSTVMLSTYSLVHGPCGLTATPAVQRRYDNFIRQVAQGIGNTHVVFFLELDSLITAPCLSRSQLAIREAELRYAVSALEADPHVVVYLDGGAADAVAPAEEAGYLRGSGVAQAQGFFLNSTHFDWTTSELRYGQKMSRMLGGAHFVVNTGENGLGPLRPGNLVKQGNEVLCNPPGRGLGPLSVVNRVAQPTGYAGADGLLWFSNPGGSGGQCVPGAPPTGVFWPAYAVMLAKNWVNRVNGPNARLARVAR